MSLHNINTSKLKTGETMWNPTYANKQSKHYKTFNYNNYLSLPQRYDPIHSKTSQNEKDLEAASELIHT